MVRLISKGRERERFEEGDEGDVETRG